MRNFLLFLLFFGVIFAKDNFIFDYKNDPMLFERFERIEREIALIKGADIEQNQAIKELQNRPLPKPSTKTVVAADVTKTRNEIAAIKKEIANLKATKQTPQNSKSLDLSELENRVALLEKNRNHTKEPASEIAKLEQKLSAQERAIVQLKDSLNESAGMPFGDYISLQKAHIEYAILGLLIFLLILLLVSLIALNRSKDASKKINQLVALYQSSSKKMEDRK